jgi:hypothetical protein
MRALYAFLTSLLIFSRTASAAVCVGNNCDLIDLFAKKAGTSLGSILSEIDRNIIVPTVDSQKMIASWEGGMLQFTPRGSESSVKITLWGGGTWKQILMGGNFLSSSIHFDYYTGNASLSLGAEIPLSRRTDLIVNGGIWSGPSDYGLGLTQGDMKETSGRLGAGIRETFFEWNDIKIFGTYGVVVGRRSADMTLAGSVVRIQISRETITWSGEEKYHERITYISTPALLGISYTLPWASFSVAGGGSLIIQNGRIGLSKWGPVGPYGGYYNVGVSDTRSISDVTIVPVVSLGTEFSMERWPGMTLSFRPGLSNVPAYGAIGLGWKFLISR